MTNSEPKTLVVDNFGGRLTQYLLGDINSGLCPQSPGLTYNIDPFIVPGLLSWTELPVQIDAAGSVITDLILAGKERVESGITYVYAIGHTGRLYKIQVNDPSTHNPDYDTPVLLTTLVSGTPTFTRGAFIEFFGATERIYISHDKGLTMIDFNGANETVVGLLASWVQNVPKPLKQFQGSLIVGNGGNIAKIIDPSTVASYNQLTTALPSNTQVRDLDISLDGNYLQMVTTRLALPDITSTSQDDKYLANVESYIMWWNGFDVDITSYQIYPTFSLNANTTFGQKQYVFGYDIAGAAIYNPTEKILTHFDAKAPMPNAVSSNGSLVGWATPEFVNGVLRGGILIFGPLDRYVGTGWWRQFGFSATGTETDVIAIPYHNLVSNFVIGSSTNGYANGVAATGKVYYSTLEVSSTPTTKYKFYKAYSVPTGTGTPSGQYTTQTQLFSKKVKISQIRIYTNPIVSGNGFTISLYNGLNLSTFAPLTIAGTSKTFTQGSNITVGDELIIYSPQSPTTLGLGLQLLNTGTTNMLFRKVEIDYTFGGI